MLATSIINPETGRMAVSREEIQKQPQNIAKTPWKIRTFDFLEERTNKKKVSWSVP